MPPVDWWVTLMPWLGTLLGGGLIAVVVLVFIAAPVVVRLMYSIAPEDLERPIDAGELPPEVVGWFETTARPLCDRGFMPVGTMGFRKSMGTTDSVGYSRLLADHHEGTWVKLGAVRTNTTGAGRREIRVMGIMTEFADGRQFQTQGGPQPSALGPLAWQRVNRFPHVRDLKLLLRLHCLILQQQPAGTRAAIPRGREEQYAMEQERRYFDAHVEVGNLFVDAAGRYRVTWKRAFLAGPKLSPPCTWVATLIVGWRERTMLRTLDRT